MIKRNSLWKRSYIYSRVHSYMTCRKNLTSNNNNNNRSNSPPQNPDNRVVCQYCNKRGHTARTCYHIKGFPKKNGPKPRANLANHQANHPNTNWIMDTGASHHITQDLQQLSLANSYPGADQVIVGDGTGLTITHTGQKKLFKHLLNLFSLKKCCVYLILNQTCYLFQNCVKLTIVLLNFFLIVLLLRI
jgi:hypothetical protein